MVTFVMVRHGLSLTNKSATYTGQNDVDLAPEGYRQAEITGRYIMENFSIDKIYSSDLCRAVNTAMPVSRETGIDIVTLKELRELDVGVWAGMKIDDVKVKYAREYEGYRTNPGQCRCVGGENYSDLAERAVRAMDAIALENEGRTVLVATHGGVLRALCCLWSGKPIDEVMQTPQLSNASVTVVKYDGDKREIVVRGSDSHLKINNTY